MHVADGRFGSNGQHNQRYGIDPPRGRGSCVWPDLTTVDHIRWEKDGQIAKWGSNGWRGDFKKTFLSNIASSPFRFEEYLASDEPNNKGFFEDLTFIGPSTGSLLQLKSGGADLNLKNWYVSQIGSFLSLEEDAFHRIDSIQVNPIYFTGSAVNLITPTSLNTDFIIQSENQGAGSGAEKPIWLNWTN